jgi:hypothetical protein
MEELLPAITILAPIIFVIAIIFGIVNLALKSGDKKDPDENKPKKHIFGSISLVLFVIVVFVLMTAR